MPEAPPLSYADAANVIADHAQALVPTRKPVRVQLASATGRVLAEDIRTPRPLPPFDRATRDGFAIRAGDIDRSLRITGLLRAGHRGTEFRLGEGEALEIMTGAPMPQGADAVLMVEHAERSGDHVRALPGRKLAAGENVVARGSEAAASAIILRAGTRIGPAQIAASASCGAAELLVSEQPTVAIFATGDELVEPGQPALDHQIYNSNAYSLAAQVIEAGAIPRIHRVLPDDLAVTEETIRSAQEPGFADLLLFSGGVSMGKFDYVETALRNRGAEFFFTSVRMQPGKPVVFGALPRADGTKQYFFGLPGNPISTLVTFALFARPLLAALSGERYAVPFVSASLSEDVRSKDGLTRFLPALVQHDLNRSVVRIVPWQGSGDLAALARSNAFLVVPPDADQFRAGNMMTVLLR